MCEIGERGWTPRQTPFKTSNNDDCEVHQQLAREGRFQPARCV